MALSNIELYEELKKNLTEEAARMIADVVPKAEDIATKGDIARLETRMDVGFAEMKGYIDSRLLRFTLMFFVPMWIAMLGMFGVVVAKL